MNYFGQTHLVDLRNGWLPGAGYLMKLWGNLGHGWYIWLTWKNIALSCGRCFKSGCESGCEAFLFILTGTLQIANQAHTVTCLNILTKNQSHSKPRCFLKFLVPLHAKVFQLRQHVRSGSTKLKQETAHQSIRIFTTTQWPNVMNSPIASVYGTRTYILPRNINHSCR